MKIFMLATLLALSALTSLAATANACQFDNPIFCPIGTPGR